MNLLDESLFIIVKNIGNDLEQLIALGHQLTVNIFLQRRYIPIHILIELLILFKRNNRTVTVLLGAIQGLIDVDIGGFFALLKMFFGVFGNA